MTPSNKAPLCVQTLWRTCGTYIWSKLRQSSAAYAYFEPCYEGLERPRSDLVRAFTSVGGQTFYRHPTDSVDFFVEYPFVRGGGVSQYLRRFAFGVYCTPEHVADEELRRYLVGLLATARAFGLRPVMKTSRWPMLTAWLKREIDAEALYLVRDPDAMFRSYWSFGGLRSYFVVASVLIIAKNSTAEMFRETASAFSIGPIVGDSTELELAKAFRVVRTLQPQAVRDIVLVIWTLALAHNVHHAKRVIDVTLLGTDYRYRARCEELLSEAVDADISLADCALPCAAEAPGDVLSERGIALAKEALRTLPDQPKWSNVRLSQQSADVLSAVV